MLFRVNIECVERQGTPLTHPEAAGGSTTRKSAHYTERHAPSQKLQLRCRAKTRQVLPLRMHSNFYEVRISKIDPVVTRAPPDMHSMSKNMAKTST
jgi:hypothetical protein